MTGFPHVLSIDSARCCTMATSSGPAQVGGLGFVEIAIPIGHRVSVMVEFACEWPGDRFERFGERISESTRVRALP